MESEKKQLSDLSKTSKRAVKIGVVKSNQMNKTVVVSVKRRVSHPLYRRVVTRTTNFLAHDGKDSCSVGDTVSIIETHPISKLKRWRLLKVIRKAS